MPQAKTHIRLVSAGRRSRYAWKHGDDKKPMQAHTSQQVEELTRKDQSQQQS